MKNVCCSKSDELASAIEICGGIYHDVKYPQVCRFSFIENAESNFPTKLLNVVTGFKVQIEVFPVVEISDSSGLKYFKSYFYVFECQNDYIVVSKHEDLHTRECSIELIRHFEINKSSIARLADTYANIPDIKVSHDSKMYLIVDNGYHVYSV